MSNKPEEIKKGYKAFGKKLPTTQLDEAPIEYPEFDKGLYPPDEYIPFPYDVFPIDMQDVLNDLEVSNQFNKDFCSLSILSCISTIMGLKYKFRYKEGWEVYPNFWFCMVAKPGDKKSPIISTVFKPLNKINKDGFLEGKQILVRNFTFESLQDIFKNNTNGICVFQDEIKTWYANQTRNNNDRRGEWLSIWSMDPMSFNTRKDGWVYIDKPMINLIGATQYDFATRMLSGDEDGMVERFLFTMKGEKFLMENEKEIDVNKLTNFYSNMEELHKGNIFKEEEVIIFPESLIKERTKLRNKIIKKQSEVDNNKLSNYLSKLDAYLPKFILLFAFLDKNWGKKDVDYIEDSLWCDSGTTFFEKISDIEITKEHLDKAYKLLLYFYQTFESLILKTNKIKELNRMSDSLDRLAINNKEKALRLKQEGVSVSLIAKNIGVTRQTIYNWIKENNQYNEKL